MAGPDPVYRMAATLQLSPPPAPEVLRETRSAARFPRPGNLSLLPCLLAAAGIALCAWISYRLGQNSGSVACFYLVIVVLTAYYGGFWQATLISIAAVACLDYFFDAPVFSFTVNRPSDWVELGTFEFTALVISHLSNRVRLRELEVAAERRDASRLYQTARRILLFENPGDPGDQIAELVRDMFELRCTVVFDAVSGNTYRSGDAEPRNVVRLTRDAYDRESDAHESGNWYSVLRIGARPIGSVSLCGANTTELTASAISSLVAIALERARSIERQCHAEAAREAEQLRTAVLDSLAHKFKTPMTVIRTAVAAGAGVNVRDVDAVQDALVVGRGRGRVVPGSPVAGDLARRRHVDARRSPSRRTASLSLVPGEVSPTARLRRPAESTGLPLTDVMTSPLLEPGLGAGAVRLHVGDERAAAGS